MIQEFGCSCNNLEALRVVLWGDYLPLGSLIRAQLFPGEQARIIKLLVRRVTVTAEVLVIDLRTYGISGVMREMMTPRQVESAE